MFKKIIFLWSIIILIVFMLFSMAFCDEKTSQKYPSHDEVASGVNSLSLIQPENLVYMGAFRLPEGSGGTGWEYGGAAMTYYPGGDPGGPEDGYGGSIFATGHPYQMYVSEINIPVPITSRNLNDLNTAETLQPFSDVRLGLFSEADGFDQTFLRVGMEYLPKQGSQNSDKLYFCWGQHCQEEAKGPSHTWCELNLSSPKTAGPWIIHDRMNYSTSDYLFEIPEKWACENTPGMLLATGRFRDGGQGGQGPCLFATGPWNEGNPPPPETCLANKTLLMYETAYTGSSHIMNNYHHSDEWSGGAWLTAGDRSAVIFVGTKGTGDCWYGFSNGTVWPDEPPFPPEPGGERGWWSTGFKGEIIFYDPSDLAAVAKGEMEPWEPQPYASMDIDNYLFNIKSPQQKYHTAAVCFDRTRSLLYVFEFLADGDKPVVHVWKVN